MMAAMMEMLSNNPFMVYVVGMSLVVILAGIFLLSLRYYIRAKDLAPYLHKVEELMAKISELKSKIDDAQIELNGKLAAITHAEKLIQQGKDAEEWLKTAKAEIEATQKSLEGVRASIESEKVHKEDLDRQISERQQQLVELEKKAVEAEKRVETANKEAEAIRKEYAELQVEVPKLRREKELLEAEVADFEEQKSKYQLLKREIAEFTLQSQHLAASIKEMDAKVGLLQKEYDALRKAKDSVSETVSRLKQERESLEAAISDLKKLQNERDALMRSNAEMIKANAIMAAQKDSIEKSNWALKQDAIAYRKELDNIRKQMEEAKITIARGEAMQTNEKNMWNDLERPVAAITGLSSNRWTTNDDNGAIDDFAANLEAAHYKFHPRTIKAFHTGLLCGDISPLLVLAGISGTGKSLLPELYASQFNMNFLPVAVQPRWDGPQDMFGFYNHMEGRYKATELSRLLYQFDRYNNDLAKRAYANNSTLPMSIVLLDEMNLARIEYYFSELLSKLEIRRNVINPASSAERFKSEIELEYGASSSNEKDGDNKSDAPKQGKRLYVGRNILFVGTMNEDESTQTLSGKVIDRSNVLRFGVPSQLMQSPDKKIFDSRLKRMVAFDTWLKWASSKGQLQQGIDLDAILQQLNIALDSVDRGFGHRTETAIKTYIDLYPGSKTDAIADQIEMKILPRLNGAEKDLVQQGVANAVNMVLTAIRAEDVQQAFDDVLNDTKSAFFSWKGVNR